MKIPEVAFTTDIQLRFSDTDQFGHINHAIFLSHLEAARLNWTRSQGYNNRDSEVRGIIAHVNFDYIKPLKLSSQPKISLRISRIGNKSYSHRYVIFEEVNGDKQIFATAKTVIVTYNYKKDQTIPIPDGYRESLLTLVP